jgi:hypothetical protein
VVTCAGVRSLVAGCRQIKRLSIGGDGVDGEVLSVVARGCPCLESLTLADTGGGAGRRPGCDHRGVSVVERILGME